MPLKRTMVQVCHSFIKLISNEGKDKKEEEVEAHSYINYDITESFSSAFNSIVSKLVIRLNEIHLLWLNGVPVVLQLFVDIDTFMRVMAHRVGCFGLTTWALTRDMTRINMEMDTSITGRCLHHRMVLPMLILGLKSYREEYVYQQYIRNHKAWCYTMLWKQYHYYLED